jgi:hypothetical protein
MLAGVVDLNQRKIYRLVPAPDFKTTSGIVGAVGPERQKGRVPKAGLVSWLRVRYHALASCLALRLTLAGWACISGPGFRRRWSRNGYFEQKPMLEASAFVFFGWPCIYRAFFLIASPTA